MTRAERVLSDYLKMLDRVNEYPNDISEKSLQMIAQSLLSISVTLARMLDSMEADGERKDKNEGNDD